jgi:hypothetical protein
MFTPITASQFEGISSLRSGWTFLIFSIQREFWKSTTFEKYQASRNLEKE